MSYRTHLNNELRINDEGKKVKLCGWVQAVRDTGFLLWIDLRDKYGITQLAFNQENSDPELLEKARRLGREFVICATGRVIERSSKNPKIPTGDIEVLVEEFQILNPSELPPFTIENETDGGEELRMKYRYLDIRRNTVAEKLMFRHRIVKLVRQYLDQQQFTEIETPYLIKSTPEGARDFVVPSRMNRGQFYALPQSPQTFKQLLMVGGMDRYYQIVKCFRDEDLRADRQPEFTQIDCEMAFVEQEDVLQSFEGLLLHLLKEVHGVEFSSIPRMTYDAAMHDYGSDKPDLRYGMKFKYLTDVVKGKGFNVLDKAEAAIAIVAPDAAEYTRKQVDALTDWVKRPQIGAGGLIYVKCNADGSFKSSVDKFYTQEDLAEWAATTEAKPGDLILMLSGDLKKVRVQLNALRTKMAEDLDLIPQNTFAPLWVLDFPLLEWDDETQRFHAMHHPFTAPKPEDVALLDAEEPGKAKANAYDLVLNGKEIGGGSIRIFDSELQQKMFSILGFTKDEAEAQFGFLMNAFKYGAPPHGGIALGLDRLVAVLDGKESIRDYIAFPKNNAGRDVMIDAPAPIDQTQLDELQITLQQED